MTAPKKNSASDRARPAISDRRRISALLKAVAENPEGGTLLQIAKDKNIRIVMSDKPGKQGAVGLFNGDEKRIDLERGAKDDMLVGILAHELRHMWQGRRTNLDADGLSAKDALVLRRVIECDAFAYQMRFEIAPKQGEIDEIKKALAELPDRKQAASALKDFNKACKKVEMKAFFDTMQQDMASYDKQTIASLQIKLKLAQLYIQQHKRLDDIPSNARKWRDLRKDADRSLRKIYNEIANPRPLPESLLDVARDGLKSDSPKYLRHENVKNLAAYVRKQIPAKTLQKAEALEKKILTTIKKSGRLG